MVMHHEMEKIHLVLLWCLVAAFTAVMFHSNGTHDLNTWLGWALHTSEIGIIEGYAAHPNYYPPLTITLLGWCQLFADYFSFAPVYIIKFSLLIFLVATTLLVYKFSGRDSLFTLCVYMALLVNSLGLAYLDIYFALPMLCGIYFLHLGRHAWFAFFFSLACLVKYQPVITAPFLLIYLLCTVVDRQRIGASCQKFLLRMVLPALLPWAIAFWVYGLAMVHSLISLATGVWLSAQALNASWILQRYLLQAGIENQYPPWSGPYVAMIRAIPEMPGLWMDRIALLFYGLSCLALMVNKKTMENLLLYSTMGTFAWFIWHTGAHENHLYLCCLLAIALYCVNHQYRYLTFGILFMSTLNMFMFYGISGKDLGVKLHQAMSVESYSYWHDPFLLLALANTLYFILIWCYVVGRGFSTARLTR